MNIDIDKYRHEINRNDTQTLSRCSSVKIIIALERLESEISELNKEYFLLKKIARNHANRCLEQESELEELKSKIKVYEDYDKMDEDGEFVPPHPIFLLAEENDRLEKESEEKNKVISELIRVIDQNGTLEYKQKIVNEALKISNTRGQITLREEV